jgi:hypothetical protein
MDRHDARERSDRDLTRATPSIGDHGDFDKMAHQRELAELVRDAGQCVLNWSAKQGYPVGVVMAYVYRHGSFWTSCTARRKRVAALRTRPRAAIILNKDGRMATYKGDAVIHSPTDADWVQVSTWVYAALSGAQRDPRNPFFRRLERFLDGPHQVIIEVPATLVLSFDFGRFSSTVRAAITASLGPVSPPAAEPVYAPTCCATAETPAPPSGRGRRGIGGLESVAGYSSGERDC